MPRLKSRVQIPFPAPGISRGYIVRCNPFSYAALPLCHQWSFSEPRSATRRNPQTGTLHGVRPRLSLVQRALQGETGNPFPVYGGGFHTRKCWPKRPTSPRLRRKTDLCITFPHTVFFAAPRPVRGAPRSPSMYWKSWLLCIKRNETVFTPFLIFLPTGTS